MRKESLIALLACGCLSSGAFLSAADWIWNPFKGRTQKTTEQPVPIRTSRPDTGRDPFLDSRTRQVSTARASLSDQMTRESSQPITNSTYRLILEESRNYPSDVREKFVLGFSKLSDEEARKRIERIRRSRAQQISTGSSAVAARDYSQDASWQQISYQEPDRTVQPNAPQSAPGVAATTSTLPEWSQFARQFPGHSSTNPDPNGARQTSAEPYSNLSGAEDPFSNPAQDVPATDQSSGMARVPWEVASQAAPRIAPAGHSNTQQLPRIRPANLHDEQSHYVAHYSPQTSAPLQNSAPAQFERPYDGNQPVSNSVSHALPSGSTPGQNLELLISRMESLAEKSQPGNTEASLQQHVTIHVELRLLYLISDQKDRALTAIPGISREEQIFWTRVFWGLTNYLDEQSPATKAERTGIALDQLRQAIQSLQGDAGLKIQNVEFCSEIENFGNYTRYDRDEFAPGQEVLVYCELENFQSERINNSFFRTLLKSSIQIRKPGANGELVDQIPYNPTEDLCRSRRKDFMQGFKYRLPQRMAAGSYVMKLVIEDQLSGKSAESSLNFVVR